MSLMNQVKQLEARAQQMSESELCPHLPPVIHWADGTVENDTPHECGKPRLKIIVGYTDGSDRRMQTAALDAFEDMRKEFDDLSPQLVAERIGERFPVTPETRAELFERVRAKSHEHTRQA